MPQQAREAAASDTGAPGTVCGTAVTGAEAAPTPAALVARMRTEYDVPNVSPAIVNGLAPDPVGIHAPPSSWYS